MHLVKVPCGVWGFGKYVGQDPECDQDYVFSFKKLVEVPCGVCVVLSMLSRMQNVTKIMYFLSKISNSLLAENNGHCSLSGDVLHYS